MIARTKYVAGKWTKRVGAHAQMGLPRLKLAQAMTCVMTTFLSARSQRLCCLDHCPRPCIRHHKGLNLQTNSSGMFKTHEQTYSGDNIFKDKFGSPECVKGVPMMHPKWKVISTSFIPPFRESKLSDRFSFYTFLLVHCIRCPKQSFVTRKSLF